MNVDTLRCPATSNGHQCMRDMPHRGQHNAAVFIAGQWSESLSWDESDSDEPRLQRLLERVRRAERSVQAATLELSSARAALWERDERMAHA